MEFFQQRLLFLIILPRDFKTDESCGRSVGSLDKKATLEFYFVIGVLERCWANGGQNVPTGTELIFCLFFNFFLIDKMH